MPFYILSNCWNIFCYTIAYFRVTQWNTVQDLNREYKEQNRKCASTLRGSLKVICGSGRIVD